MSTLYRLNVDFDNNIVPFLYEDTGNYSFTVPSSPNFMGTRYVVFLPAVMILNDVSKIPAISGYTRVEGVSPSTGEWRTIAAANYESLLLKDAIEFHSSAAGANLTITNFWSIGSVVDPAQMVAEASRDENRKGLGFYTERSTGVDMDLSKGILKYSVGFCKVNDTAIYKTSPGTFTPAAQLTASRWHVVYLDESGVISIEEMSGASDYTVLPASYLDSAAPINSEKNARYKSGDNTKRAVACCFSLPTQSNYSAGTTYSRGQCVRYLVGAVYKNYISRVDSNIGHSPDSSPVYWLEMGDEGYIFSPKIYNFPESTFGTGSLGDVTLDGTGAGATATPLYGIREEVASTPFEHGEYHFNNLIISGTVYCGKSNGNSLDPVIIRVKGTLTIESGGQLNGDERGANGGTGGSGGTAGTSAYAGGAGGAGAKSGRPIYIYANKIINKKTSGYWITCQAGNPSSGSAGGGGSGGSYFGGGGGGGGCQSTSSLKIITNSKLDKNYININLASASGGDGGSGGTVTGLSSYGGGGGGAGGLAPLSRKAGKCGFRGTGLLNSGAPGGGVFSASMHWETYGALYMAGYNGGAGGISAGSGVSGIGYDGGGGGTGFLSGADGGQGIGAGGGGGGGRGTVAVAGSSPVVSHDNLGELVIFESYDSREAI